jgi:hypothetical protein
MKRDEWLPDWNPAGAGKFHRKLQKVEISFGQIPLVVSLWDWDRVENGQKWRFRT